MNGRVLVLIPAHNESPRIVPVIESALRHLPVIVVDDGSADDTGSVAEAAGARVVRQPANLGKGEALKAGFRRAIADGVAAVVTLDADGQHDPAEIPAFLAERERTGAELVVGAREFGAMPPTRRLANTLGKRVLHWATGREIRDNQSGYRLVGRRLMEAMLASEEPGFGFEVEMIVECARRGWAIEWVPIRTIYGAEKSHIHPVTHLARFLKLAWRIRRARSG
ncbi:MAG TPA: glycosyltransferase family 2 protein [Gemmatimonadota bacterium]|nr:glycosyltransferase family 2 protein [Gemmatimonadota bacterium]